MDEILRKMSEYAYFVRAGKVLPGDISKFEQKNSVTIPSDYRRLLETLGGGSFENGPTYFNLMDVGSNDLGRNLPKIPSKFFLFGKVPISKWLVLNSADGQVYETDGQGITQRWGSLAEYLQYELVEDQKYRERFEK